MGQPIFADLEYKGKKRKTRRSCSWNARTV